MLFVEHRILLDLVCQKKRFNFEICCSVLQSVAQCCSLPEATLDTLPEFSLESEGSTFANEGIFITGRAQWARTADSIL